MNRSEIRPFFSVIICTYNRADIICRALDSLTRQEDSDWEGIIVDDGSTDKTMEIINPYLTGSFPFRLIQKKHSGLAKTRNAGIRAASGRYITFLDTDDKYAPEHLRLRHQILRQRPEIDLLHSNVTLIGDPFLPNKNHPEKKIHIDDCIVGGTFFIKRNSLSPDNLFQDGYSDDSRFMEKMKAAEKNILKIDAPTYLYFRDREDSLTHQASE